MCWLVFMPEFHCRYRSQKVSFVKELMKKKILGTLENIHINTLRKFYSFLISIIKKMEPEINFK
jgi:hypothetical protein